MGAGASSAAQDMEEIITATYLLGQAISALTFPDMYRLYDFQSKKAPFPSFQAAIDSESQPTPGSSGGGGENEFSVKLGNDTIVIEDLGKTNAASWTPLHSCCHTQMGIPSALAIIDEMYDRGLSFETKTTRGPGSHNSGWTALHMACAYGLEEVANSLISKGASVNTHNSLDWTPLHETCHRGMASLTHTLLRAGADPTHVPDLQRSRNIPFSRPPPTTPLGEAARRGFKDVTQVLLDFGAPKDGVNALGWSPLHEASFNNHTEVVQLLLVHGADPALVNMEGAAPIHLASNPDLKAVLADMGSGVPALRARKTPFTFTTVWVDASEIAATAVESASRQLQLTDGARRPNVSEEKDGSSQSAPSSSSSSGGVSPAKAVPMMTTTTPPRKGGGGNRRMDVMMEGEPAEEKGSPSSEGKAEDLLHSGGMLGNLPSLSAHKSPMAKDVRQSDHSFNDIYSEMQKPPANPATRYFQNAAAAASLESPSATAQRQKKQQQSARSAQKLPAEFLCEITKQPLIEPVRTPYGNVYERDKIMQWFDRNGSICPITGLPLCATELEEASDLVQRIKLFTLESSLKEQQKTPKGFLIAPESSTSDDAGLCDELYDFSFTPRG